MIECPFCMSENDDAAKFCAGCGSEMQQKPPSPIVDPHLKETEGKPVQPITTVKPIPSSMVNTSNDTPVLDSISQRTKSEMNYLNIFARHQKEQATKTAFARKLFPLRKKPTV